MSKPFKSRPDEFNQRLLFPTNIFDLLTSDHECYLYADILKQLDTSELEKMYSQLGQRAYHPRSIISILVYAYSQGVFSSREIEKKCNEDLAFMYIAEINCPNFRVLSDFRKNNADFFEDCFKQSVLLAMELGLASLGHVSLDGSKFKADTSKHKAMSFKRFKEKEKELMAEIEILIQKAHKCDEEEDKEYKENTGYEIPEDLKYKEERLAKIQAAKEALIKREEKLNPGKPIDDKKQISFADFEALIMGKQGSGFDYQYNGQICVDEDSQIIITQFISQNVNDKKEIKPAIEKMLETTGQLPSKMSTDNGYMSADNLEALKTVDLDTYMAINKGEKESKVSLDESNRNLVKADFTYNEQGDCFICPAGQILSLKSRSKDGEKTYQGSSETCSICKYKSRCCKSKKGEARTISADDKEPLRQEMKKKMELESSKEIYKQRKVIVEPVFGQIKNTGFRGFSVRGLEKTSGEFSLVCTVHNIKKIMRAVLRGVIRSESGRLEQVMT